MSVVAPPPAVHGPALTGEQRTAVERRTGDVLLVAGAGSGKTRVLTERFVAAVAEDGVDPTAILAMTFTEKAAGELAERIRARLRELGREEDARAAEGGWIGTIHGWAAGVLRAHPLRAGIDPRFAVLDEVGAERLEREAWEGALGGWVEAEGEPAEELLAAYDADRLGVAIRAVHAERRARGAEPALPPPPSAAGPATVARAAAAVGRAERAVRDELGAGDLPDRVAGPLAACRALLAAEDALPAPLALAALALPKGNGNGLRGEACETYREAVAAWEQACLDARAARALPVLDALLRRHAAAYAERKHRAGVLDFADLELRARDLLRDDPGLRDAWRERFALVMVDEFQDTNRLQLELLELVTHGNLFSVGDPLQAIYGFRHADPDILAERRAALAPAGAVLGLTESFRARPEIVRAVDDAFGPLFGEGFIPLRAGRADPPDGEPRVELLLTEYEGWDPAGLLPEGTPAPVAAWRLAEARLLAQEIRGMVDAGRPAGEVVVLVRAATDLSAYARAIEDAGVSTYLVGGRGFWGRREVQDLVAWLSVVANPRDEGRLFEVLASPLVGVGADALVAVGAAGRDRWRALREWDPTGPLGTLGPEDARRLRAFVRGLAAERAGAPRRPLAELVERALRFGDHDLHLLRLPGGERRLANARKLIRLAREWEREAGRDLRGFLDLVAQRSGEEAAEAREGEAPVEGDDLGAVRLMTIHRAKGLEFPVVCVADLGRARHHDETEVVRLGEGGEVGLRLATAGGGRSRPALAYARLGEAARARADAEEKRLFWVAATRAQERLVLSGAVRFGCWPDPAGPKAPPVAWLAPALAPDLRARVEAGERRGRTGEVAWTVSCPDEVGGVLRTESLAPVPAPPVPASRPGTAPAPPPRSAPSAPPALERLSFSALEEYRRCAYRFHAERVLRLPRTDPAPRAGDRTGGLPATVRGTLVHALLEELPPGPPPAPDRARLEALAAREGVVLAPAEAEDVLALAAAWGRSPLAPRVAAAPRVAREEPFSFLHDGLLVTGVLDVLAREEEDAVLVVDFKTNALGGTDPAEVVQRSYAAQRLVYALALLQGGARSVEVAFVFLERPEAPAVRTFTPADLPGLEAGLTELLGGIAAGRFPVTPDPGEEVCSGCPARGTLCSYTVAETRA